jgi:hypothetical protein
MSIVATYRIEIMTSVGSRVEGEKPSFDEYPTWLKSKKKIDERELSENYYDIVTSSIQRQLISSKFWTNLTGNLTKYEQEYNSIKDNYDLFKEFPKNEDVKIKPYKSFIEKTYRKNVLNNKEWPDEPEGGWIFPDRWFSNINDIVRTTIVVKYLDGVDFLVQKVIDNCGRCHLDPKISWEARDEGYYAVHINVRQNYKILSIDLLGTKEINVSFEIQITTQLQEVIRRLLHSYYEGKRLKIMKDEIWQWNYMSDEFATNYLGHILHYVEGMIMDIREKNRVKKELK